MKPVSTTYYEEDKQHILHYFKSGDSSCFSDLYKKYYTTVYNHCMRLVNNSDDALDLTQDVFIKAFQKIKSLRSPEYFKYWLFKITQHACLKFIHNNKKERKEREQFTQWLMSAYDDETPDQEKKISKLMTAVEALPDASKEIITLKYLEGKSIKDLQKRYKTTASGIKMRLFRARARVAKLQGQLDISA